MGADFDAAVAGRGILDSADFDFAEWLGVVEPVVDPQAGLGGPDGDANFGLEGIDEFRIDPGVKCEGDVAARAFAGDVLGFENGGG